jgi:hypothetical protein
MAQRLAFAGAAGSVNNEPSYTQKLWTGVKRKAAYLPG